MTETAEKLSPINGVDVQALVDTIGAIQADPGLADFEFRADNQWIQGGHNRSEIRDFRVCDHWQSQALAGEASRSCLAADQLWGIRKSRGMIGGCPH